jgi:hypothetical protein
MENQKAGMVAVVGVAVVATLAALVAQYEGVTVEPTVAIVEPTVLTAV